MSWTSTRIEDSPLGFCTLDKRILQDRVEDVFRLIKYETQINSSGKPFLNAVQALDPEHFRGSLLRRPFQAISDIIVEHPDAYAAILQHEHVGHPHKAGSHFKDVLEFHRHDEDLDEIPPIVFHTFQAPSLLPCEPLMHPEQQIRLSVAIRRRLGSSDCAPSHIGVATAYRWNSKESPWPEFVVAQGSTQNFQWLLNVSNDSKGPFVKFWKTTLASHSDDESDAASQAGSQASAQSESANESDVECVHQVLHGLAEDASDVRQALLNRTAIQKTCT